MQYYSIYGEFEALDDSQQIEWLQSWARTSSRADVPLFVLREISKDRQLMYGGTWLLTVKPLQEAVKDMVANHETQRPDIASIKTKIFADPDPMKVKLEHVETVQLGIDGEMKVDLKIDEKVTVRIETRPMSRSVMYVQTNFKGYEPPEELIDFADSVDDYVDDERIFTLQIGLHSLRRTSPDAAGPSTPPAIGWYRTLDEKTLTWLPEKTLKLAG